MVQLALCNKDTIKGQELSVCFMEVPVLMTVEIKLILVCLDPRGPLI